MNQSVIFARARPSVIRLTEQYHYQADVSSNPQTKWVGTPGGLVEVLVPYDGQEGFTALSIGDIERQLSDAWTRERVEARIGYLALTDHTRTNLEEGFSLSLHHGVLPLDVPVQGDGIRGPDGLRDDRHTCRITYPYSPEWPETNPLKLGVSILDEEIIKQVIMDEEEAQTSVLDNVARGVAQQAGFNRSLFFHFSLHLALPSHVGSARDVNPPVLAYMALEWPVATSYRSVHLLVGEEEWPLAYNPERGVVEWGHVRFKSFDKAEGTDLHLYDTPAITLLVDQPGELYRKERLSGEVRIEIPRPFSGLRATCFDAQGRRLEAHIEPLTVLTTTLDIYLEDCFERKVYSPYQHLQFEGIILDDMRIADIMTLLEDQGFKPIYRELASDAVRTRRYLVGGVRQEGPEELTLWMFIEGTRSQTTRRKQIPGGQTFTTELETGNMVIYMRGQLRGDSLRLVGVMNEIQTMLKERFRHVSTIG